MMMVSVFYRLTIIVFRNDDGFSVLQTDYNCCNDDGFSVLQTDYNCCNDDGFTVLQTDYNCLL